MSMTETMARVERMAMRGFDVDQILAAGVTLSPKTVTSVVTRTRAAIERDRDAKTAAEQRAERLAKAAAERERAARERFRVIDAHVAGLPSSIAEIIRSAATRHGTTTDEIRGTSRGFKLVAARQEAMYLCAEQTPYSLTQIGRFFRRDHTTVLHGVRTHCARAGIPLPRGMQPEGTRA